MLVIEEDQTIAKLPQNTWLKERASSLPIHLTTPKRTSGGFFAQGEDNYCSSKLNSNTNQN